MAVNQYRGEVAVEIGGEMRVLRFSWDALARAKADVGDQLFNAVVDMDFDLMARLLTAGLAEAWPEVTADEIRSLSPPVLVIQQALIQALNLAFYGSKEGPAAKPSADPTTTGEGQETGSSSPGESPLNAVSTPLNSGG